MFVCGILIGASVLPESFEMKEEVREQHLEVKSLYDVCASPWKWPNLARGKALEDLQNYVFNLVRDDCRTAFASVDAGHRLLEILTEETTREQFSKSVVSSSRTCVCCNQIEL